jgi:hypothetical protein
VGKLVESGKDYVEPRGRGCSQRCAIHVLATVFGVNASWPVDSSKPLVLSSRLLEKLEGFSLASNQTTVGMVFFKRALDTIGREYSNYLLGTINRTRHTDLGLAICRNAGERCGER